MIPFKNENQDLIYLDCNYEDFRKSRSKKAIRKTISIPEWLDYQLAQRDLNLSKLVQKAICEELGLEGFF